MQLKQLLNDDDAVSPVIGVILMVAITVILAAVIGTFVLGLGDQVQETSPNAQWDWDQAANNDVTLTHEGGNEVPVDSVKMTGSALSDDITNLNATSGTGALSGNSSDFGVAEIGAGDSVTINSSAHLSSPGELRLVWEVDGQSDTLTTYDYEE